VRNALRGINAPSEVKEAMQILDFDEQGWSEIYRAIVSGEVKCVEVISELEDAAAVISSWKAGDDIEMYKAYGRMQKKIANDKDTTIHDKDITIRIFNLKDRERKKLASNAGKKRYGEPRKEFKDDYRAERGDDPDVAAPRPKTIAELKKFYPDIATTTLERWAKKADKEDAFNRPAGRPKKG